MQYVHVLIHVHCTERTTWILNVIFFQYIRVIFPVHVSFNTHLRSLCIQVLKHLSLKSETTNNTHLICHWKSWPCLSGGILHGICGSCSPSRMTYVTSCVGAWPSTLLTGSSIWTSLTWITMEWTNNIYSVLAKIHGQWGDQFYVFFLSCRSIKFNLDVGQRLNRPISIKWKWSPIVFEL